MEIVFSCKIQTQYFVFHFEQWPAVQSYKNQRKWVYKYVQLIGYYRYRQTRQLLVYLGL
jgi:hypothetical protein